MASRRNQTIALPAPYLRRIWLEPERIADRAAYPFCLPFLRDDFELVFDRPITIIAGENGTGKSTLLEGIAVLAGYDEAGGGKGYMPVDHSDAIDVSGARLTTALRAGWLPKVTNGWFFRAESFFAVARYQDKINTEVIPGVPPGIPPDYLSHSHGEGFLRFFQERCQKQGIFIFDEPESALSPSRQMEFLKLNTFFFRASNYLVQISNQLFGPRPMNFIQSTIWLDSLRRLARPAVLPRLAHLNLLRIDGHL